MVSAHHVLARLRHPIALTLMLSRNLNRSFEYLHPLVILEDILSAGLYGWLAS